MAVAQRRAEALGAVHSVAVSRGFGIFAVTAIVTWTVLSLAFICAKTRLAELQSMSSYLSKRVSALSTERDMLLKRVADDASSVSEVQIAERLGLGPRGRERLVIVLPQCPPVQETPLSYFAPRYSPIVSPSQLAQRAAGR